MSNDSNTVDGGLSRRAFAGLGVAAGAGAVLAATHGTSAVAAPAISHAALRPEVLGAIKPALSYLQLDAFAFFTNTAESRVYSDNSGVQPMSTPNHMNAALPLPVGSVIYQLNAAFYGTPILEIWKRVMTAPLPYLTVFQQTLNPPEPSPHTTTIDLATPITIEHGSTYAVRMRCSAAQSVYGVTIGYLPPTQSFIPFTGPTPRILDTRNGGGKLMPDEERVINLGLTGRSAVLNLTVTGTVGTATSGGYVAVFADGVAYPGNSSINWTGADRDVANGVIAAMSPAGAIKIRGGSNPTHVVIDRIGSLL